MNTPRSDRYVGVHDDLYGGMTELGRIVREAWVFGLLPESEDCKGWDRARIDDLYARVSVAWEPWGHMVSRLPDELRARHARIFEAAIRRARASGWSAELDDEDE